MGIDEFIRQEGREIGIEEGREIGVKQGIEEGRHQMQHVLVENLLKGTEFSDDKIASLANVTAEYVEDLRREIK